MLVAKRFLPARDSSLAPIANVAAKVGEWASFRASAIAALLCADAWSG